jgi:hypothetical protein
MCKNRTLHTHTHTKKEKKKKKKRKTPTPTQSQILIKTPKKKKKIEIIRKQIRTFGWGPHRQSGSFHESDPLNSEAERAQEDLCN